LTAADEWLLSPEHSRLAEPRRGQTDDQDPRLAWWEFEPQTGGICCNHPGPFFVVPLEPTDRARTAIAELEQMWLGSNAGCPSTTLDDAIRYREAVRRLFDADCSYAYSGFQEAVYPMDWDEALVSTLSAHGGVPFDQLVTAWRKPGTDRWLDFVYDPQPALSEFRVMIFGNNSD
jgi:hypothetical protein